MEEYRAPHGPRMSLSGSVGSTSRSQLKRETKGVSQLEKVFARYYEQIN